MPQLRLEYSSNVKETLNPEDLFSSCHRVLVETADADLLRCQSRAISFDVFHVGSGSSKEAFIYLEVLLMEGRSEEKLEKMGKQMLQVLEQYFHRSLKELKLQISVHITELPSARYFKIESQ